MNKLFKKECESSCEYILPDYFGDVKKILTVSASAVPAGRFISDGELHTSGIVNYNVVYCDSENKMTGFTVTSDYDQSFAVGDGAVDSFLTTRVVNFATRPTGPRKILLKSQVEISANVTCEEDLSVLGDAFSEGRKPETEAVDIMCEECFFGTLAEREYADEAQHLAVAAEAIEIISSSGIVRIDEAEAVNDGVRVRGELIVTAIIKSDGGTPYAIKKSIPFEETVEVEGAMDGMQAMASGTLSSLRCVAVDDAEGSKITVNAIAELSATAAKNSAVPVIKDAYLKEFDTLPTYAEHEYRQLLFMGTTSETFQGKAVNGDAPTDGIRNLINTVAQTKNVVSEVRGEGVLYKGELVVSGMACQVNDAGEEQYVPLRFGMPFEVFANFNCHIPEDATLEINVIVTDTECILDSDGISVRCDLSLYCHASERRKVRRLCECSVTSPSTALDPRCVVTVYYPEEGESIFEIAKKYRTTRAKIAADNDLDTATALLPGAEASGVKRLIIKK